MFWLSAFISALFTVHPPADSAFSVSFFPPRFSRRHFVCLCSILRNYKVAVSASISFYALCPHESVDLRRVQYHPRPFSILSTYTYFPYKGILLFDLFLFASFPWSPPDYVFYTLKFSSTHFENCLL